MKGLPLVWWCDKADDGAPVVRVSCKTPGGVEARSQYKLNPRCPMLMVPFVFLSLTYEMEMLVGTELPQAQPVGLLGGAQ
jgi:hypothetical protein